MPLRLEIKKELTARSDRVKSVDIYPAENPWVLTALYSGHVYIWDYSTNTLTKSFELCEVPVRCAKFIARKQWFIAGTDDMHLRVYNYNTMEKVKEWEAHTDYIRFVEVHPNRPYVISSSDDMSIKLWDWEKDFECVQVYEGHVHYVMMVKVNPRDTNTFASASLDRSIKVWGLTASTAHFSLEGPGAHERGVNCVDYYPGGDKPYLLSGADDRTVKIWDYQTKACLQTLEGHSHNVSSVCFHPRLPLIISSSEDGTVRLYHSTTYRPETTLNYGMERSWCLAPTKDANKVAIGYDEGTIVLKLGNERPVGSMDCNTGKIVWANGHEIQTTSVKGAAKEQESSDGEKITLNTRDLGSCEVYPQNLQHNCNGQFIVVCGDGEYIIYTSQALRNKAFGSALDFVWSNQGTGDFAIRESISRVKLFKNFKEHKTLALPISSAEGLMGGHCLAVRGSDSVIFFDWDEGEFIRKIDVEADTLYWNDAASAVVVQCSESYFVLTYDKEKVADAIMNGTVDPEEGVDGSFELDANITEQVKTGQWVGECFLYTDGNGKLNYYVGGETITLARLERPMYLLGFVPREDRVFLIDKAYNVVSYKLMLSVLNYQTAVVRNDFDAANEFLPTIPHSELAATARFLESQGFKEEALEVTTDSEHKFELAIDLKKIAVAKEILMEVKDEEESIEYQAKWKRLGDLALHFGDIDLAQVCAEKAEDLSGLLLLYSSAGNKEGMVRLGERACAAGRSNVAFIAYFITGKVEECIDLLVDTNRLPEAAFLARTYFPSKIDSVLELWKKDLSSINEKAAEALADPAKYANLFPDLDIALQVEKMFVSNRDKSVPASKYMDAKGELDLNLIEMIKNSNQSTTAAPAPAEPKPEEKEEVMEKVVEEVADKVSMSAPTPEPEPVEEPEVTPPPPPAEKSKKEEKVAAPTGEIEKKVVEPKGIESSEFIKKLCQIDKSRDYIIIVDRSASMKLQGRWKEAEAACKVLCHHACKCDADGITLYFFSSHSVTSKSTTPAFTKYENVASGQDVMKQFESKVNAPHGGTDLVSVLKDAFVSSDGKAISILVITDGMPDEPTEVAELIRDTANGLTKPDDILVSILQVGDDHKADEYLNELDEGLEKIGCTNDIVDVISHQMMVDELKESGSFAKLIERGVERLEGVDEADDDLDLDDL